MYLLFLGHCGGLQTHGEWFKPNSCQQLTTGAKELCYRGQRNEGGILRFPHSHGA